MFCLPMAYDYGFRIYSPEIGKFLSVDPLTGDFPFYTPYQFSANNPITSIDLDGLEAVITINSSWFKNEIDKAITTKTIEGNERASFLAFHSLTVDRPADIAGSTYVRDLYGGEDLAGTFNYSEDNPLGLTVLDQDGNELFNVSQVVPEHNSSQHWYDPILNFFRGLDASLNENGEGFIFTTETGLVGQVGHVRGGDVEGTIEIDLLMAAVGAAGSAAANKQVLFPGKNAKEVAEGLKQIYEAAQTGENVIEALEVQKGTIPSGLDTKFICPTCNSPFLPVDTTEHNESLGRDSGPFKPQENED